MMIDNVTAVDLVVRNGRPRANYDVFITAKALAQDLIDARKELEGAKKDSVWREIPDDVSYASVEYLSSNGIRWSVPHKRTLPKTPKQELIDSFAEKNALAMKCSGLNKELLEAFVKEYEEVMKPLDK